MAIEHKLINYNWGNGFKTTNTILNTPYEPQVMIIGTFNHGWNWNQADFFYGRGLYMWTVLANIFIYNQNCLSKQRTINNVEPSFEQLFTICKKGKLTFADIVLKTKPQVKIEQKKNQLL
jgi:hypothetical protein